MRFIIAGGGCYGSYYVRQLERARKLGKLSVSEVIVVDQNPQCAVSKTIRSIPGGRIEVSRWEAFGQQVFLNRKLWFEEDRWVPTPIGPHILFHWMANELARVQGETWEPLRFDGSIPALPYAQVTPTGTLVLSHAPGVCPTNCVEPKICPLTRGPRDWEMKDTVATLAREARSIEAVSTFVCQHYSHGVGTIAMKEIYEGWDYLLDSVKRGAKHLAVATVSSCHGILDGFKLKGLGGFKLKGPEILG